MSARTAAVRRAAVAVVSFACAVLGYETASAEEGGRWYVGVGVGRLAYSGNYGGIGYEESPAALRVHGGFQLGDRSAIELSLQRADGLSTGEIAGSGIERLEIASDYSAIGVRGMFRVALRDLVPSWQRTTVFATAGAFAADEKRRVERRVAGITVADVVDDGGITYGLGVVYGLPRLGLRTSIERLDGRKDNPTTVEIAAELRFGRR